MQKIIFNGGMDAEVLYNSAFVLTDENLDRLYGGLLPKNKMVIKPGESSKNFSTVEQIITRMLKLGIKREDRIAAFGGGVVGDILGFAASIYMRGIEWDYVPTSLLAMVDGSIGGKTAVNVGLIKNAVGAFHMPDTYIETKFLRTLPENEFDNGMGEVVKTSLLNKELFDIMHGKFSIEDVIQRCVKIKSEIVDKDFFDKGVRKALNLGHTVGHAVEMLTGLGHGKSVLLGLRLETLMLRDDIDHDFFYDLQAFLDDFIDESEFNFDAEAVAVIAASDKKNKQGINIVYPQNIGNVKEVMLSEKEFIRALKEVM